MSNETDPHLLVAIMQRAFAQKQDSFPRRVNLEGHTLERGITEDRITSIRTFPILDAIASLSVSQGTHEVYAVALQVDPVNQKIRLTIAGNQGVPVYLKAHLVKVWGKLQELSTQYAENRGLDPNSERSPRVPKGVALPTRVDIFRDICQFSLEKLVTRGEKWRAGLSHFMRQLVKHRKTGLQGVELDLFHATLGLLKLHKSLSGLHLDSKKEFTHKEWVDIYQESMWASKCTQRVLEYDNGTGCEKLARKLGGRRCYGGPFRLRRALEKLNSLPRNIKILVAFANSRRLRPALQYAMSIVAVPAQTRFIPLPRSQDDWLLVLQNETEQHYPWQLGEAEALLQAFKPPRKKCDVHCECSLIQYLERCHASGTAWDKIPPFNYLGVSKLSCYACYLWITAFNEQGGRKIFTRGSHGKWCFPWAMPNSGKNLVRSMAKKLSKEYYAYLSMSGLIWLDEDSTPPSSPVGGEDSDTEEDGERAAMIATMVEESGGIAEAFSAFLY
ncbi:hypothetical protein B9Z19DRAFT_1069257 [Tuber borchii]|uniref:Uncharacterized protein n=1 Tax=Tuber borchii TaxID=42251 RepID=A0A2T6ZC68_TUBBO|nr:hypothetical protein B9Z19DRAFT_1069257 [Tuber borchii]